MTRAVFLADRAVTHEGPRRWLDGLNWATEVFAAEVRARARSGSHAHKDDGVVDELSEVERGKI